MNNFEEQYNPSYGYQNRDWNDNEFLKRVTKDIEEFLVDLKPCLAKSKVLVFPPLNNHWRYLIHKVGEQFGCGTFSVGDGDNRLTVVAAVPLDSIKSTDEAKPVMESKAEPKGAISKSRKQLRPDAPIYVPPAVRKSNQEENVHIPKCPQSNKSTIVNKSPATINTNKKKESRSLPKKNKPEINVNKISEIKCVDEKMQDKKIVEDLPAVITNEVKKQDRDEQSDDIKDHLHNAPSNNVKEDIYCYKNSEERHLFVLPTENIISKCNISEDAYDLLLCHETLNSININNIEERQEESDKPYEKLILSSVSEEVSSDNVSLTCVELGNCFNSKIFDEKLDSSLLCDSSISENNTAVADDRNPITQITECESNLSNFSEMSIPCPSDTDHDSVGLSTQTVIVEVPGTKFVPMKSPENNKHASPKNDDNIGWEKYRDRDEEEFRRASEEINRRNKRIMKSSFTKSDILIIDSVHKRNLDKNKDFQEDTSTVDSWEELFDDSGHLNSVVLKEINKQVGDVTVSKTKDDYREFKKKQNIDIHLTHVIELYNFPAEFQTRDLVTIFDTFKSGSYHIKWVDDSHALAVFSCATVANEVLRQINHPLIKLRPMCEASKQSISKAKRYPNAMLPTVERPQTCPQTARRMVTGALGIKMHNAKEEREKEKKILKEARDKKKLEAKQQDDAWEGRTTSSSV